MKRFRILLAAATAAALLSACRENRQEILSPTRTVHFHVRSIETRSVFGTPDGKTYPTFWTDQDKTVGISMNYGTAREAAIYPSEDYTAATFDASFELGGESAFTFYAISPARAASAMSPSRHGWTVSVPTTQTPLPSSVEESAQILVAKSTETEVLPDDIDLTFKHLTAYGRVRLTGMGEAAVNKVDFVFGTPVAGQWYYACSDGSMTPKAASSTITVLTDATGDIWFACAPTDLSGTTLRVIVYTDEKRAYTQEVTFPEGRQLVSGRIAAFSVDMTDAFEEEIAEPAWQLLQDESELALGDRIVIVEKDNGYAISTSQNKNNRGAAAVSETDGVLEEPSESVEILTLESGSTSGTWAFKTRERKYLASGEEPTKNILRTLDQINGYSSWTVTVSDGIATIKSQSGKDRNNLLYNPTNTLFACYKEITAQTRAVRIYRYGEGPSGSGTPVKDDPVLDQEAYGAYLKGTDYVFNAETDQIRRSEEGGLRSFSILTPEKTILVISLIPSSIRQGSTFPIQVRRTVGKTTSLDASYTVTVLREIGPRFWLSDGKGNGFIVKL